MISDNDLTDVSVPVKIDEDASYIRDYYALYEIWKSLHGEDVKYVVYPKVIEEYIKDNNIDLDNLPDFIVSSEDITPENRVKTQATWQHYIDASIKIFVAY